MAGSHTDFSPSGAKRWSRCYASVAACAGLPSRPNEKSALGTAKHSVSELYLTKNLEIHPKAQIGHFIAADGFKFKIDADFMDHVSMYVNNARLIPGKHSYETRVDTSGVLGVPKQGGTIDLLVEDEVHRILTVGDAKFGFIPVSPEDNEQEIIYAAAALDLLDPFRALFDTVQLIIFQPQSGDLPKIHPYTREELDARMVPIREAAIKGHALIGASQQVIEAAKLPSPIACEWCPIRDTCEARAASIANMFPIEEAKTPVAQRVAGLSDQQVADFLERIDDIEKWCRDLRKDGLRRALAGTLPGWKIIEGRKGNRAFADGQVGGLVDMAVRADIGETDEIYKPRLLESPAGIEKLYKRLKKTAEFTALSDWAVTQADGAPSLARESEPGALWKGTMVEFGLESPA